MIFIGILAAIAVTDIRFLSIQELLFTTVLYFVFAGVYVQTYPAVQATAPSLEIVHIVGRSKTGLTLAEVLEASESARRINERVEDLFQEGFINSEGDTISLTTKGKLLALTFVKYREILGLEEGKG